MPGLHFRECDTDLEHFVLTNEVRSAHRDKCGLVNRQRNGFWRWFFATIRCNCSCHTPGSPESYDVIIREAEEVLL